MKKTDPSVTMMHKITPITISKILYEMNAVWRKIMRKENDAIKKRLTG